MGGNLKVEVKYEFLKNMTIYSRVDLFSNYLEDPQNVDVRWDVQLNMTVNKWFSGQYFHKPDSMTTILKSFKKMEVKGHAYNLKKVWV